VLKTRNVENSTSAGLLRVLVISQHDAVRRQLVAYLGRSSGLAVSGDEFSAETIVRAHPQVLVLDLSRLDPRTLLQALDTTRRIGASVIALASIRDPADERAVVEAGGLYRLKSAGADGLTEIVRAAAAQSGRPNAQVAYTHPIAAGTPITSESNGAR
jgi:DNA-binding NarL/FixJ family response regulator